MKGRWICVLGRASLWTPPLWEADRQVERLNLPVTVASRPPLAFLGLTLTPPPLPQGSTTLCLIYRSIVRLLFKLKCNTWTWRGLSCESPGLDCDQ